jgi:uncharacterized membrane protein YraQ (UPF0718 family)
VRQRGCCSALPGKGVPISTCIAFLLAAPILNPVAIFATATAFRFRPEMVWLRGGLAFVIAASVGLLVGHLGRGEELLAGGLAKRRGHEHPRQTGTYTSMGMTTRTSMATAAYWRRLARSSVRSPVNLWG